MNISMAKLIALIKAIAGSGGGGGGVSDVKVDSTSVVTNGVANVPLASASNPGVVKVDNNNFTGIGMNNGLLFVSKASGNQIKAGTNENKPIVPLNQHTSVFYAMAKAAGDSTQSASSNAVGTYTETAKSAISEMLNAPETVSGATPSITAKAGVRYICGEVSTISITPPASGAIDVVFESGSTPAVLTVPSTVKFPAWFDPDDLDADVTYEINILDGVYGVVTSWA